MSLEETKKDLAKQIEEASKVEEKEAKAEDEALDKPVEQEAPAEDKPVEEEKPVKTPSEYARERRESKARLAEELAAANARIAELTAPKVEAVSADPEPDRAEEPDKWIDWSIRQKVKPMVEAELKDIRDWKAEEERTRSNENLRTRADQEIQAFEDEVRKTTPDYDNIKSYYANMLAASIKIVNPEISNDNLVKLVRDRMMGRAAEFLNKGHDNPLIPMMEEAKKLGYKPPANGEDKEEIKPDLAKVAANRARNAGTAAAQGEGGKGELTPKVAAGMTNAEFAKLKPDEKARMFKQLQGVV